MPALRCNLRSRTLPPGAFLPTLQTWLLKIIAAKAGCGKMMAAGVWQMSPPRPTRRLFRSCQTTQAIHAAYAELLWRIFLQYKYPTLDSQPGPGDATLQHLVDQINSTLKLDPKNEQAQSLSDWIQGTYPEIVSVTDAGRLTLATPASSSQTIPTSTPAQPSPPVSTATGIHTATSTPTLAPTAIPSTPTLRPVSPTTHPATATQPAPSTPDRPITPSVVVVAGVAVILVLFGGVLALVW